MKVRVVTEASQVMRNMWLKKGTVYFAVFEAAEDMLEANDVWATRDGGPFPVRYVYSSAKADTGYCAVGDSGIKTPYDIKPGTKIIYLTALGARARTLMETILAWGQVDPEDVEWVPASSWTVVSKLMIDKKGEVSIGSPITPVWYEVEACPHGLTWIELNASEDPEGAQRFLELYPSAQFGVMSQGVPSAHGVWGMTSLKGNCTRADTDPELVYHLVKWMDENHEKYKDAHVVCPTITIDTLMGLAETSFIPLHDGTVRYLEEKGLWTEAHEKRQQQNIELIDRYIAAYQAAIILADDKGIDVDPENKAWLELWESYKRELGLPRFKMFMGLD